MNAYTDTPIGIYDSPHALNRILIYALLYTRTMYTLVLLDLT